MTNDLPPVTVRNLNCLKLGTDVSDWILGASADALKEHIAQSMQRYILEALTGDEPPWAFLAEEGYLGVYISFPGSLDSPSLQFRLTSVVDDAISDNIIPATGKLDPGAGWLLRFAEELETCAAKIKEAAK